MDPRTALRHLGGAARRDAILSQSVSEPALRAALSRGEVFRPFRGTYSLPGTATGLVVAASLRGQLACVSACDWWGLDALRYPDVPHVIVPTDRHPQDERLRRLRVVGTHRDDSFVPGRLVQPVDIAVDHVAWCTTPLEQLVILDCALFKRLIDPLELPALTKGPAARRDWLSRNATSLSESPLETVGRAVLMAAGFRPRVQVRYERVGRVDMAVGTKHIIELDGWKTHQSREAFIEDRRRDREVAATRKWSLRFTYWDVVDDPRAFVLDVARIIGLRVSPRFDERLRWMTTLPLEHLNRRPQAAFRI